MDELSHIFSASHAEGLLLEYYRDLLLVITAQKPHGSLDIKIKQHYTPERKD
ncbi:hypothetical protein SLEP1_g19444 [Rubroshorea leprosula]|uniref:Maturase K n=1 Tax=Rubroshorea leprosula TaxID=152421 RepID=A0AAV5J2U3_9ROSI|nr:hypothetical protein SLEP1_g19444 [Rubroshorea leprosula]